MKNLIFLRGLPGSGKSTWVKEHNLELYTLSADDIRLILNGPKMNINGNYEINQDNSKRAFELLTEAAESRMKNGELIIIDNTNINVKNMTPLINLSKQYDYQNFCVDFTDIPLETVKNQNRNRDPLKMVPEEVIDRMNNTLESSHLPNSVEIIGRDEFEKKLSEKPIDLSSYKKVHHLGDIHGSYDALMEYIGPEGIKDDEAYIFIGDYLDRGNKNKEVLDFVLSNYTKSNMIFLEGNHEIHLKKWAKGKESYSKEFEKNTSKDIESVDKKDVLKFYRSLKPYCHYTYKGKEVLVCHGGIPKIDKNLLYTPTHDLINGVGGFPDAGKVIDSWNKWSKDNFYMIFGHRNEEHLLVDNNKCFNLEGQVEFGGQLRAVDLDKDGFDVHEIDNFKYVSYEKPEKNPNKIIFNKTIELLQPMSDKKFRTCLMAAIKNDFEFNKHKDAEKILMEAAKDFCGYNNKKNNIEKNIIKENIEEILNPIINELKIAIDKLSEDLEKTNIVQKDAKEISDSNDSKSEPQKTQKNKFPLKNNDDIDR